MNLTNNKNMTKAIILGFTTSEHGKSKELIQCPKCKTKQEVYSWSFAGCGKKCECGVKLGR